MDRKPIDYAKIKKEYMIEDTTIYALAKKYKVATSALYRRAQKEGWDERKAKAEEKRDIKLAERGLKERDEAWQTVQNKMRDALITEWERIRLGESTQTIPGLTRATKDAKEMGIFGATLQEQKLQKEIELLTAQLNGSQAQEVRLILEGGNDYGD